MSDPAAAGGSERPGLLRVIGRWSLCALVINSIIGSGIFSLPTQVATSLGSAAPFAYLFAALGIGVVMACFAEVGSQFRTSGGPYVYARAAFGPLVGVQMGWFLWLVRLTAAAANANIFVEYLAGLWDAAAQPLPRAAVLVALLGVLAVVNVCGARPGTRVNDFFVVAKLLPIALFVVLGAYWLGPEVHVTFAGPPGGQWFVAILALVFAFGGFETALIPMGEVKDPRRDVPFALFTALGLVAVVYGSVHLIVMAAFPDPAAFTDPAVYKRPVAEAARTFLGSTGAVMIAVGVMLSTYGNLAAQFVSGPRLTFALAEQGDFPRFLAAVHPRFRTPYVSIVVHAVLVGALAIFGSFIANAILSAAARLLTYAAVCAAVIVLRRKHPEATAYRVRGGWLLPLLGMSFCVVIASQMNANHAWIGLAVLGAGTANWAWTRRQRQVSA